MVDSEARIASPHLRPCAIVLLAGALSGCVPAIVSTLLASAGGGGGHGQTAPTPAPPPPSAPAPTVASVSPASGPIAGGTSVTITGSGFVAGATVRIGGVALENVVVAGSGSISGVTSCTVHVGAADVEVTTAAGTDSLTAGFDYQLGLVQEGAPYVVATTPVALLAADVDSDGDVDLVIAHRGDTLTRLMNDGTGRFTTGPGITATNKRLFGLAAADLDHDGALDLVAAAIDDDELLVLRGSGFAVAPPVITNVTLYPEHLALGDLDGDGALDAAIPLFGSGLGLTPSSVRVQRGSGGHFETTGTDVPVGNGPQMTAVLDIDGDGKLDIVCTNLHSPGIGLLRGNGDGTFVAHQLVATGDLSDGLAVADFDGDGKADLIATHQLTPPVLVRFDAQGALTTTTLTTSQTGHWRGIAIDVNRDGWSDLVAVVDGQARCSVFLNQRDGTFAESLLALPPGVGQWTYEVTGDFDNDGRPDLAVVSETQALLAVFLNH